MELGTRLGELLMPNYDNYDGEEDCNSDDDHENDAVDESGNNADDGPAQATRLGELLMPNYDQQYDYHNDNYNHSYNDNYENGDDDQEN